MAKLSHTDNSGKANMVDTGHKPDQLRTARAEGFIRLNTEAVRLIKENNIKKGDVLTLAEVAGIMATKKTSELIPLCHPLMITKIEVSSELTKNGVRVKSMARCIGKTGIEMEALTAVSVALLTVYDMCKAVDRNMVIEKVYLVDKTKE